MNVVVSSAYRWKNGMVMVFDTTGRQIPDLQGEYTVDLHRRIREHSSAGTKWYGFGEDGPVEWPSPAPRCPFCGVVEGETFVAENHWPTCASRA